MVFWTARENEFVHFDDPIYVTENPHVQKGITPETISWAFTTRYANFWHPLTWLSHALDCQLFGLNPAGHHLSAVLWHTANAALLFWVLWAMTGARWRSAVVAALFALHPLHVESVAWVSERKDLVSTFFWLLTMLAYTRYVELTRPGAAAKPRRKWYALALVFFVLGMMAKPMLVTLPFVLLLLDVWPYRRWQPGVASGEIKTSTVPLSRLVVEKLPYFAVAAIASFVAFSAQKEGGALPSFGTVPLESRLANALVSYARYLGKTVFPVDLAVPYPFQAWSGAQIAGAAVLLLAVSVAAVMLTRKAPWLAVGWFWYVGTLVPVIGLVQIGEFSMADRYTYVPLIGVFIAVAWGLERLTCDKPTPRKALALVALFALFGCVVLTRQQIRVWRNTETLFTHAIRVTPENYLAHYNLGRNLIARGRAEEALVQFEKALQIRPTNIDACNNIAGTYAAMGKMDRALEYLKKGAVLDPNNADIHYNLGFILHKQGHIADAMRHYREAIRLRSDYISPLRNLAWILATSEEPALRDGAEALRLAKRACELTRFEDVRCLDALDAAYAETGDFAKAISIARQIQQTASLTGKPQLAASAAQRLSVYQSGRPWRER